jgi:hypothetical protein
MLKTSGATFDYISVEKVLTTEFAGFFFLFYFLSLFAFILIQ